MKIVSSAKMSEKHQLNLKTKYPMVQFFFFDDIAGAEEELKTADVLITYGEDLTAEVIEQSKDLKWIQVISAGINKMPFAKLMEKNILVTNAKGIHYKPMSEYTMGVILQLARKTNEIYKNQLAHHWNRTIRVAEVNGTTLGVVGLGSIGQGIVEKAKAFDMRVIGMNTDGRPVDHVEKVYRPSQLKELLAESDYVVVIVPLTDKTYHLIGKEELQAMKNTAYLINIARGEVVEEEALVDALKSNQIAGAVLDVFSEEPLPSEHPFWSLENCIITPHLSGRSPKYMERALEIFVYNLDQYLDKKIDQMLNRVELSKGY
ncbi:D-2-hydroxyacid dehydrogenase [Tepidibacillus sp. HK-1]|uniref:D-2-hydroxyacid dehydrogenase n=1 Tax=Tepidibacillus sp. HK-1 TaxID=1883407 RepID=UPI00085319B8|nr:D-2-hydroxyacid dehydrogenase [Tepidibacillus sp. HK-1]GBF12365.1 glyoxylate/hydroxypyruvate reductase B [Tepidibacillus sp. HK-1]